jgi:hypothetical protein
MLENYENNEKNKGQNGLTHRYVVALQPTLSIP